VPSSRRARRRAWPHCGLLLAAVGGMVGGAAPPAAAARPAPLRVCADPNNLPFSDRSGAGFENKLAQMLGRELGGGVEYVWWAQRRGALRNTLKASLCDVVMGVPVSLDSLATTRPYYRSGYVFVSRASRDLDISSFDDPRLRELTIGVQVVGDDYANTPPVHALSARGISDNVRGYSVLGDYAEATPSAKIVLAVEAGDVDIAIVWGPLAGYFARRSRQPLRLVPTPARDSGLPMRFAIGMGVRRGDVALKDKLEAFIAHYGTRVDALLDGYGVPRP
jgi:mxaJ protein